MTGRDLICYILENNLENRPVVQNGKLCGFLTAEEAAVKFNVGIATIYAWYELGVIDGFTLYGNLFVPSMAKPSTEYGDPLKITGEVLKSYTDKYFDGNKNSKRSDEK